MSHEAIPFSKLTPAQLLETHNALAAERCRPLLKSLLGLDRVQLVQAVALLRATPVISSAAADKIKPNKPRTPKHIKWLKRPPIKRDAMLKALAIVDFYECPITGERSATPKPGYRSVGLDYREVAKRVQADCGKPVSNGFLRLTACCVRAGEPGHEGCKLPDKRPHKCWGGKR